MANLKNLPLPGADEKFINSKGWALYNDRLSGLWRGFRNEALTDDDVTIYCESKKSAIKETIRVIKEEESTMLDEKSQMACNPVNLPKGWIAVPTIGTRVKANHPISPGNPDEYFVVTKIEFRDNGFDKDRSAYFVSGENTMGFGSNMIMPHPDDTADMPKVYEVWIADLDSLYNEKPNSPILHAKYATYDEARITKYKCQDYRTAAWIVFEEKIIE